MDPSPPILIVDDDREIRELLSRFLRKHGFRVSVAVDGREMGKALAPEGGLCATVTLPVGTAAVEEAQSRLHA